ncbi:hypothetical protein MSAN_01246800 [Mycena sanguinolenta]|uniref:Uncharacterized protein n=1 Tax=Mycena sanguinolenta TaxID=230812 RepID=A0A8H6YDF7_9AGAR|nr:hypothetical protein MSAN_01246800 [Mycena sanguinolenta]
MKTTSTVVAFLSFASLAFAYGGVSPSCQAQDRVLVKSRTLSVDGHEIQISTKACSADVLEASRRPLAKRQVFDACEGETTTYTCVTNEGTGPLEADCAALQTALPAALANEGNPSSFEVPPQFAEEFSLGTCLWAFINENPVGGATLSYCYVGVEVNGENLDESCIVPGDTGGFTTVSNPNLNPIVLDWTFEVLHS